ncbi:alginate export family protein [Sphingomonas sp. XMGL2]|uniref:Alginate export family protein n=2 Tax=Sphingomonas quercus TaxID=2842451 RepID=A0ABS6BD72_9SPHN|nr:alginate export family protein [Sphingomonas quercus]MBU3076258.1 alginate export family protein [Sphingomonas quercus]
MGWGMVMAAAGFSPAVAADSNPLHEWVDAPDNLTLKLNFRTRVEGIDGQLRPNIARRDLLTTFRTTLLADYDTGPVHIVGELRDARGYAEKDNSSAGINEVNALEPLQAYLRFDLDGMTGKGSRGALTAGRFTLDIGAGRLAARPDFSDSVNSFTGVSFDWTGQGKDHLLLFWTMPSTRLPSDPDAIHHNRVELDRARTGLQFFGGDYTRPLIAGVTGEAYVFRLAERDASYQATRNRHLVTYGGRLFRKPQTNSFDFEVEGIGQTGHARASTAATDRKDVDVSAWLIHGEVGRKFGGPWAPRISFHGDKITGEDSDPSKITRFDSLYGAARTDFGPSSLYGMVSRANLRSVGVRLEAAPSKKLDGFVMVRGLWLDSKTDSFGSTGVRDARGRSGDHAGTQVEGRVRYWFVPKIFRVEAGGAVLARGRFLKDAPNAPDNGDAHYFFLDFVTDF